MSLTQNFILGESPLKPRYFGFVCSPASAGKLARDWIVIDTDQNTGGCPFRGLPFKVPSYGYISVSVIEVYEKSFAEA